MAPGAGAPEPRGGRVLEGTICRALSWDSGEGDLVVATGEGLRDAPTTTAAAEWLRRDLT